MRVIYQWRGLVASLVLVLPLALGLSTAAQTNTESFDNLAAKAASAREQGDVTGALELYRQAVKLNANWADGWWFLGSLHYGANEYTAARDALTHFVQLTPEAGPALALRGLCEFELGDYDLSLNDIQRGISLGAANQPRNEKILRYHEALLLAHKGDFEAALDRYAQLARGNEPNADLLASIGSARNKTSSRFSSALRSRPTRIIFMATCCSPPIPTRPLSNSSGSWRLRRPTLWRKPWSPGMP